MIRIKNYTLDEFFKQINKKQIICFCGGKKLKELCDTFRLEGRILYVVDNYIQDNSIRLGNKDIPVVSMEKMGNEIKECLLLITTIRYVDEIIAQLDEVTMCDGLIFYVPELFTVVDNYVEFDVGQPTKIPKCIHYCWFGKEKIPERFCRNIETWKRYCQDYEIKRWDESNYDVSKNIYMKQAYEAKKWGFVPDYARLDIVNKYGGIYLDTDVEILKPLDSLLQFEMFCGFESPGYIALGLGFGATQGNKIIKAMMNEYDKLQFILPDGSQNLVASPVYQTQVLEKFGLKKNGKTQIKKDFTVLSSEYLAPVNEYGFGAPKDHSFSIHQYAATWFEEGQDKKKRRFIKNYEYILSRLQ